MEEVVAFDQLCEYRDDQIWQCRLREGHPGQHLPRCSCGTTGDGSFDDREACPEHGEGVRRFAAANGELPPR
jgi:hypothetical protein